METYVSLTKCVSYNDKEVKDAIWESLEPLSIKSVIQKGCTVLIKPNMFQGFSPEKCGTTHPSVLRALVQILQQHLNVKILVGDNPACLKSESYERYEEIADITEVKKVVEETNSILVYPDTAIEVSGWTISKIALQADVIINLPKLKGHGFMGLSGAIKNMFGLVPGLRKLNYHVTSKKRIQFAKMLIGLCKLLKPRLTIMDAIEILDKEGSIARKPQLVGAIIASPSSFATDLIAVKLLRLDPMSIPVVAEVIKNKALNSEKILLVGQRIEKFRYPKLKFNGYASNNLEFQESQGNALPKINKQNCVTCGTCLMLCPFSAILIENEELIIKENLCRKCYCCLEMCKFGALYLS